MHLDEALDKVLMELDQTFISQSSTVGTSAPSMSSDRIRLGEIERHVDSSHDERTLKVVCNYRFESCNNGPRRLGVPLKGEVDEALGLLKVDRIDNAKEVKTRCQSCCRMADQTNRVRRWSRP